MLSLLGLIALIVVICKFHGVAQLVMNGTTMEFKSIKIMQPTDTNFQAAIVGRIAGAGPINAATQPMNITIHYKQDALGWMQMPAIQLSMGVADINITAPFTIMNQSAFVEFSKDMITGK